MSLGCPTLDAAQSAEILAKSLRNTRETSEQDGSRKCVTGEVADRLMRSEGGTEGAPLRDPRELHGTLDKMDEKMDRNTANPMMQKPYLMILVF